MVRGCADVFVTMYGDIVSLRLTLGARRFSASLTRLSDPGGLQGPAPPVHGPGAGTERERHSPAGTQYQGGRAWIGTHSTGRNTQDPHSSGRVALSHTRQFLEQLGNLFILLSSHPLAEQSGQLPACLRSGGGLWAQAPGCPSKDQSPWGRGLLPPQREALISAWFPGTPRSREVPSPASVTQQVIPARLRAPDNGLPSSPSEKWGSWQAEGRWVGAEGGDQV